MTNQTPDHSNNAPHHVAALYHFAPLNNREDVREALLDLCMEKGVLGTILLAEEGVNGTISGSEDALAAILAHIRSWSGFAETEAKYSIASEAPFLRMKMRPRRNASPCSAPAAYAVKRRPLMCGRRALPMSCI